MLKNKKHIHFIGIGGIGMSGIASYLQSKNYLISGSDMEGSENTERLINNGITVTIGHRSTNITNPDLVVITSAISKDNIELQTVIERNIPILSRAEILAEICKLTKYTIAISGTHGKTSTTSLIGFIFKEAGLNPVIISGGIIKDFATNFIAGGDLVTIVEADEYDRSFLKLHPDFAIINNIDPDHMECYGTLENLQENFIKFANQVKNKVILNSDDKNIISILDKINSDKLYFSTLSKTDIFAQKIQFLESETIFYLNDTKFEIPLLGMHNIKNSLAAIAIALEFEIPLQTIQSALQKYNGVKRRFEIIYQSKKHILVDDYAHHPKEIATTIDGTKKSWPNRNLLTIFQPHLYSRTKYFFKEFAKALSNADKIIITDIYPAREKPMIGVSGKLIFDELTKLKTANITYAEKEENWIKEIIKLKEDGDIIISFGAGDINKIHKQLIDTIN